MMWEGRARRVKCRAWGGVCGGQGEGRYVGTGLSEVSLGDRGIKPDFHLPGSLSHLRMRPRRTRGNLRRNHEEVIPSPEQEMPH